ncbi:MAG: sensor histidine kinase [Chloroflexota bacterium]
MPSRRSGDSNRREHRPPPTEINQGPGEGCAENAERRRAEEERERLLAEVQQANQQLAAAILRERELAQESEQRAVELDATIASVADGLMTFGAGGEILHVNPAAERMLGFSPEQEHLLLSEWLALLHLETPDGKPIPLEELPPQRALRGETTRGVVAVIHPPTGKTLWVSVSAAPICSADGRILGAVLTFTDITAIHDLQEQREDFARMISHDLRNPLTPIMGQASLLQRRLAERGMDRESRGAETILKSSQRMNAMIQELVESTRLEAGKLELHKEPTDLCQLLHDISQRVGRVEDRSRLRVECGERVPLVPVDRERIERAIANLITNALKYSPPDSPVTIRADRRDGDAQVSVADHGMVITPEELPHVFDRFYRIRGGKKVEGLGLGLYITRLVVEAHGGRIGVESRPGKGSTFHFTLPSANGAQSESQNSAA